MVTYKLKRPTDADLASWAAKLRDLPPGHEDRRAAARAALPVDWRTRDKLVAPELPPLDDLELWRSLGASHALGWRAPLFSTIPANAQPAPHVVAYSTGFLSTIKGHLMNEAQQISIVDANANALDLGGQTLATFMTSGDVSGMDPQYQAEVLISLHKMFGLNPLSKAWIIVDKKIYPTAAAASAVRRKHGLECDVLETTTVELGGVQLVKCVAECRDPSTGQAERATSFVSWEVNGWGEERGVKVWKDPNPDEVADKMMKAQTKAIRRATLLFAALGSSAAEDLPADLPRDYIEQLPDVEPPASDEAGS